MGHIPSVVHSLHRALGGPYLDLLTIFTIFSTSPPSGAAAGLTAGAKAVRLFFLPWAHPSWSSNAYDDFCRTSLHLVASTFSVPGLKSLGRRPKVVDDGWRHRPGRRPNLPGSIGGAEWMI